MSKKHVARVQVTWKATLHMEFLPKPNVPDTELDPVLDAEIHELVEEMAASDPAAMLEHADLEEIKILENREEEFVDDPRRN